MHDFEQDAQESQIQSLCKIHGGAAIRQMEQKHPGHFACFKTASVILFTGDHTFRVSRVCETRSKSKSSACLGARAWRHNLSAQGHLLHGQKHTTPRATLTAKSSTYLLDAGTAGDRSTPVRKIDCRSNQTGSGVV